MLRCVEPLPLYRPRNPQASDLWRLLDQHFPAFQQVYDEQFAPRYGFWRPVIERSVIDPLACPECGGVMKVVAFIEPPQRDVIEKILKHCGLWQPATPRPPPADECRELTFVDEDTFWSTF